MSTYCTAGLGPPCTLHSARYAGNSYSKTLRVRDLHHGVAKGEYLDRGSKGWAIPECQLVCPVADKGHRTMKGLIREQVYEKEDSSSRVVKTGVHCQTTTADFMPQFLLDESMGRGPKETATNGVPKLSFDSIEETLEAFSTMTLHLSRYRVSILLTSTVIDPHHRARSIHHCSRLHVP